MEYTNRNPKWFQVDKVRLVDSNFNIACCNSFTDKRLVYVDYFKYTWVSTDPMIDRNPIGALEISTNSAKSSARSGADKPASSSWVCGELQIEKTICWSFSKTIRVDIRPLSLCVNKTEHSVLLIEKNSKGEVDYDIEPNFGNNQ